MIKKEVKQYKRGKTGYVQRIDFNKHDNLKEGQIINILTEKELKNIKHNNKEKIEYLQEQCKEFHIEIEEKDRSILELTTQLTESLKEKDRSINNVTKQLNKAINDKNNYKDTIAGLKIIIGKYRNRNLMERLINKPLKLDKEDQELITADERMIDVNNSE